MPDPDPAEGASDGATPVDPDVAEALIPGHIRTRGELNEWEQANIVRAALWARRTDARALDESTVRALHRRMFDRTWTWAGRYRTIDTNLGVAWTTVPEQVRQLLDDGIWWFEHRMWSEREAALRLHHRLVAVHPFVNGNGRHARLWCDLLLRQRGVAPIRWRARRAD